MQQDATRLAVSHWGLEMIFMPHGHFFLGTLGSQTEPTKLCACWKELRRFLSNKLKPRPELGLENSSRHWTEWVISGRRTSFELRTSLPLPDDSKDESDFFSFLLIFLLVFRPYACLPNIFTSWKAGKETKHLIFPSHPPETSSVK